MKRRFLFLILIGVLAASLILVSFKKKPLKNDKVIRFHVIANSDSYEDQSLKLNVRDKILEKYSLAFKDISDIKQCRKIIKSNINNIKNTAEQVIHQHGKDYSVNITYGDFDFPTKMYGNVVYPAGRYEALRVVIGKGSGKNWWCVMFPPLCFIDVSHGIIANNSQQAVKTEENDQKEDNKIKTDDNEQQKPDNTEKPDANGKKAQTKTNNSLDPKGNVKVIEGTDTPNIQYRSFIADLWNNSEPRIYNFFNNLINELK